VENKVKRLRQLLLASALSFVTCLLIISLAVNPVIVNAQSYPSSVVVYNEPALEQLLAPIALYPDELLSHVLAVALYPQEVVAAAHFVHTPFSSNYARAQAAVSEPWDDSAKYLVQFPNVLDMMNDNLDWTQRLGDAFYNQQGAVMNAIQVLRQRALNQRTLASNQQIRVEIDSGGFIVIKARSSSRIYVPYYNPTYVYGEWDQPDYPPFVFEPPVEYQQSYYSPVIAFGVAIVIIDSLFFPIYPDWHHHYLRHGNWRGHDNWRPNTQWRFNQQRRAAAVTFNSTNTQNRFQRTPTPGQNTTLNRDPRGVITNQTPLNRSPLVQRAPTPVQQSAPTPVQSNTINRDPRGVVTNQAPLNRSPLVQRAPTPVQQSAPTPVQSNTINRDPRGVVTNQAPVLQPNAQPNPRFSRGGMPNRSPMNTIQEENRVQPRAQPNPRFSREAAPVRPPANIVREEIRTPAAPPRMQPNVAPPPRANEPPRMQPNAAPQRGNDSIRGDPRRRREP
jgi:hypothetical protein